MHRTLVNVTYSGPLSCDKMVLRCTGTLYTSSLGPSSLEEKGDRLLKKMKKYDSGENIARFVPQLLVQVALEQSVDAVA
jgi:hypothetical protein